MTARLESKDYIICRESQSIVCLLKEDQAPQSSDGSRVVVRWCDGKSGKVLWCGLLLAHASHLGGLEMVIPVTARHRPACRGILLHGQDQPALAHFPRIFVQCQGNHGILSIPQIKVMIRFSYFGTLIG